jgi:hypothetical protein
MTFASRFNVLFAIIGVYLGLSMSQGQSLLSMYDLFSSEVLVLRFILLFVLTMVVFITIEQFCRQRKRIRAALSLRRSPKLRALVKSGVNPGSFAYLATPVRYGDSGMLPAMTVLFVVDHAGQQNPHAEVEAPSFYVVPYFENMPKDQPLFPVIVSGSELYPHIPRHMIPELI